MNTAQVIVNTLRIQGIECIFCLPGVLDSRQCTPWAAWKTHWPPPRDEHADPASWGGGAHALGLKSGQGWVSGMGGTRNAAGAALARYLPYLAFILGGLSAVC